MKNGKFSVIPFLIAMIAVLALLIGLRAFLDHADSAYNEYDTAVGTQVEIAEPVSEEAAATVEEQSSEEVSSEEATAEETSEVAEAESETESVSEPTTAEEPVQATSALRFRNKKLLNDHYNKHGIDMGFASAEEYEAAAAAVAVNPNALHKTEKEDGDDVYYVEATNEFVVVSTDGYIRTYFCPDSGIKYYNKQ